MQKLNDEAQIGIASPTRKVVEKFSNGGFSCTSLRVRAKSREVSGVEFERTWSGIEFVIL